YDDWIVDEPELKIPHPLMYKRDFVMIPLREIMD
ncbi:MAG: 2-amino-4-hydroxy-6-hydroxymethyldihydropteridine diphosphokinase, partial [Prevotella sp.]|nr:2-amino-4-hydroxy-6-hydroxymethyldihydropteridine diphosphokinase [Prevotella sp.]